MSAFRMLRSAPFILTIFSIVQALVFAGLPLLKSAANSACSSSSPSSNAYTVTICFTNPGNSATLSGNVTITATGSLTSSITGIQRMLFTLNGAYLLTDYSNPYSFTLPTANWVDGSYTLAVQAMLRDSFMSQPATLTVKFSNGVSTPPVNQNHFQPTSGTKPEDGAPFVVVAAGDGASGENNAEKVVSLISSIKPNLLLYLGDVYEKGSTTEFSNWYGLDGNRFGTFRSITDPTVGNHEYTSDPTAKGYFNYWDNIPNFYSFDAGGWHFISLNSNSYAIGTTVKSEQYQWLAKDLAAHANACTVVYYHHPLFNIGPEGSTTTMTDIWALLARNGVTMVLNGHDHDYQRWVPLDANGQPSASGVTEFIAGGAGHGLQTFNRTDSRVAYSNDTNPQAFGVLKFTLHESSADFSYINSSKAMLDSGNIACNKVKSVSADQGLAMPTGLSANAPNANEVDLSWQAPAGQATISGYTVYRNGTALATVAGNALNYADTAATAGASYTYSLDAFDSSGMHSAQTTSVNVTMPAFVVSATPASQPTSTAAVIRVNTPTPGVINPGVTTPVGLPTSNVQGLQNPLTPSIPGLIALGGLVFIILIGIFVIARRHF
jgi:hypothetical protein